jgi:hypothetical protein
LDYWEHPDYNDERWVKKTKANLGEKGWLQEVLRSFLGSGENYIPSEVLSELEEFTAQLSPARALFEQWTNETEEEEGFVRGAFHIFKEPIEGRDYILGVDVAEGMGTEGDNTCIQVIDMLTCEQVAEFYSNTVLPNTLSQIVSQIGHYYNTAMAVIENNGPGTTVLSKLMYEINYENVYYESNKRESAGVKTTKQNRPIILESLQNRLLNRSLIVRSKRLVKEMKTFIYNKVTKRAEASSGHHDDAIIAISLALYGRDCSIRHVPVAMSLEPNKQLTPATRKELYEEIKAELSKDAPDRWFKNVHDEEKMENDFFKENPMTREEELMFNLNVRVNRPLRSLLKEFGW